MSLRDRLEIFLITYNRSDYLRQTLESVLAYDSPVKDFDITILDNASTDATGDVIRDFQSHHSNLKHIVHPRNIGGNANIVRALELGSKEYQWTICDDDKYDWQGWGEVERAVESGEKLICVCNYLLEGKEYQKDPLPHLIQQMTFVPSIILHRDLINDTVMKNAYDSIFSMFPHLVPVVMYVNNGGTPFAIKRAVVKVWDHQVDGSYVRGCKKSDVFDRNASMVISVGYANIVANIRNRKLARRCYNLLVTGRQLGRLVFFGEVFLHLRGRKNLMNFVDVWMQSSFLTKFVLFFVRIVQNSFLYGIITNERLYRGLRRLVDRLNRRKYLRCEKETAKAEAVRRATEAAEMK